MWRKLFDTFFAMSYPICLFKWWNDIILAEIWQNTEIWYGHSKFSALLSLCLGTVHWLSSIFSYYYFIIVLECFYFLLALKCLMTLWSPIPQPSCKWIYLREKENNFSVTLLNLSWSRLCSFPDFTGPVLKCHGFLMRL